MIFSINAHSRNVPLQVRKGCAMTLRAASKGVLRVTSGRIWATADARYPSDCVLARGAELPVEAGQTVVIESWPVGLEDGSGLVWAQSTPPASGWAAFKQRLPIFFDRHHSVGAGGCTAG